MATKGNGDFPFSISTTLGNENIIVDKFGENPLITTSTDPEDVWDGGGMYNFTANGGADYYISSSDAGDTQDIRIQMLTEDSNANWNLEVFEVTLAGQAKTLIEPPSGNKPVRIFRMENQGTTDLAGTMYVYEDSTVTLGVPDDLTKVRAQIVNGNNQTLMAIYTIPTGYVGFLTRGEVGLNFTGTVGAGTHFAKFDYRSRRFGEVFKIKKRISCITLGASNYQDKRSFPDPIPAKTDIKIVCEEVSDDMGVWATFDILLIKEEEFNNSYLNTIGQIKRVS